MRFMQVLGVLCLLQLVAAGPAWAHEERESSFPPGKGHVPVHRTADEAADVLVVCKPDSADRIAEIADAKLRSANRALLARCEFEHLQAAVDAVSKRGTNIYVLPGQYREEPSWNPSCADDYDGGVVSYELIVRCGEVVNLVTVAGDDPADPDIVCDNQLCDLQIEGTGGKPEDVTFTGGFRPDGDWVKHNGIKADRADGFYLANMTFELFRENSIYVHETDGYALDRIVTRNNDLYGVLTFTSDHGLISNCEAYHNGDSGVYPGSAADVNAQSTETGPLNRWAVEIKNCNLHHNTLGVSGTAGNSVYLHDSDIHHNGMGLGFESILSGHPGMPQDHAWIENNKFRSNNVNYYGNNQGPDAPCQEEKPVDRGHQDGVVCPALPMPVGTGVFLVGNHNYVHANEFTDNWRQGVMLFWIPPAALREEYDPAKQFDNSNHNAFTGNEMGFTRDGQVLPNGLDFWWDDAGVGNCWQDNLAAPGRSITHNATSPLGLPTCGTKSMLPVSNPVKTTLLLPCAQYDRYSNPDPVGCDWIKTPPQPGTQAAPAVIGQEAPAGARTLISLFAVGGLLAVGFWVSRRVRALS